MFVVSVVVSCASSFVFGLVPSARIVPPEIAALHPSASVARRLRMSVSPCPCLAHLRVSVNLFLFVSVSACLFVSESLCRCVSVCAFLCAHVLVLISMCFCVYVCPSIAILVQANLAQKLDPRIASARPSLTVDPAKTPSGRRTVAIRFGDAHHVDGLIQFYFTPS